VGVGHDTDFTIADFAADVRAPTPSAAAELAVPNLVDLRRELVARRQGLDAAVTRTMNSRRERVATLNERLQRQSPARRLPELQQRLDERVQRLSRALTAGLDRARQLLGADRSRLEALSPLAVLARGYSLARDGEGRVVTSALALGPGQPLVTVFADGRAFSTVDRVEAEAERG
jgi:exodeoxyribonuclease VII large subunit